MQRRRIRPHLVAKGNYHGFSQNAVGTWGIFSNYGRDDPLELIFVPQHQDSWLLTRDTSGISSRLGRAIGMFLKVSWETEVPFPFATVISGFLSMFQKSQALSSFEALNSVCLSTCQRDMSPPVEMRRGPRAFSRVSTGDSDILSPCEMKDEPAYKPLQGIPAFFRVRASRCPFHLRQQIQDHSHIHISEGSLLLRCLCQVGIPL